MTKKKQILYIEKPPFVKGVYKFCATIGLPLSEILLKFSEEKLIVDWEDYIKEGLSEKENFINLKAKILENIKTANLLKGNNNENI